MRLRILMILILIIIVVSITGCTERGAQREYPVIQVSKNNFGDYHIYYHNENLNATLKTTMNFEYDTIIVSNKTRFVDECPNCMGDNRVLYLNTSDVIKE